MLEWSSWGETDSHEFFFFGSSRGGLADFTCACPTRTFFLFFFQSRMERMRGVAEAARRSSAATPATSFAAPGASRPF